MTKEERHNKQLNKIVAPEIERLTKREKISDEILNEIEKRATVDYNGLDKCHYINAIGNVIDCLVN